MVAIKSSVTSENAHGGVLTENDFDLLFHNRIDGSLDELLKTLESSV